MALEAAHTPLASVVAKETTLPRILRDAGPMKAGERGISVGAGDVRERLPFPSRADILFVFRLTYRVSVQTAVRPE